MVRVDGELDPETGETFLSALASILDAEARTRTEEDVRSPAQRRADALGELSRQWLDRSDRPEIAGERPHMGVTVSLDALTGASADPAELDRAGALPAHVAARIGCDASIRRIVLSPMSEPLDVGRATRTVPPAMRRAVVLRDRHCRFPGCDRPHAWCDAHHAVHWARGGDTSLANLVLLCRPHHRLMHERGGFGVVMREGGPRFTRPDGSQLEDRAPP